jgi:hypothetical protein
MRALCQRLGFDERRDDGLVRVTLALPPAA